jgi:hypothetical protein
MSRKKWLCLDCKVDTGKISEHYFVTTNLWMALVGSNKGMLCIGCLEKRLGRKLQLCDFTDCYINDPKKNAMSIRLQERLTA